MAAATVTNKVYEKGQAVPGQEVVVLTASDTNTYVAKTLSRVDGVVGSLMEDAGALTIPLSFDVSGKTVTINATGLSSLKVCLVLYGV